MKIIKQISVFEILPTEGLTVDFTKFSSSGISPHLPHQYVHKYAHE